MIPTSEQNIAVLKAMQVRACYVDWRKICAQQTTLHAR